MNYSDFQNSLNLTAPINANIEVTRRCNLKCIFCSADASNQCSDDELSLEDLMNFADELRELKVFKVKVTGGEPFLKKGIMDFLRKLSPYQRITINSNGTLITEEIAMQLSDFNMDKMIISLDSGVPGINDKLRGTGSFKRIVEGIKLLKKYQIPVSISAVLTRLNMNHIPEFVKVVKELGSSSFGFNHLHPQGRGDATYRELALTHDERRAFSEMLDDFNQKNDDFTISLEQAHWYKMEVRFENWKANHGKSMKRYLFPCHAGLNQIGILANGDVVPCLLMDHQVAGNIKKEKISQMWKHSPVFKKMKEVATTEIQELKGCDICKYNPICAGGCRAKAYLKSNDIFGVDPNCPYHDNN